MSDAGIDIETVRWEATHGVMLAADVAGDPRAQTVLLFHGGGQTRHSWGGTLRALVGRGYHVASIDLRGHARIVRVDLPARGSAGEDGVVLAGVALEFERPLDFSYSWV